jgi:hypothetical protein
VNQVMAQFFASLHRIAEFRGHGGGYGYRSRKIERMRATSLVVRGGVFLRGARPQVPRPTSSGGLSYKAKDSSYCSVECEAVKNMPDIDCRCTHTGCKGRAH